MKKKDAKELIKMILEDFDFQKVHDLLVREDWRWFDVETDGKVPSVKQLKKEAQDLLKSVCYCSEDGGEPYRFNASGGLCAEKRGDSLELRFEYEVAVADKQWLER